MYIYPKHLLLKKTILLLPDCAVKCTYSIKKWLNGCDPSVGFRTDPAITKPEVPADKEDQEAVTSPQSTYLGSKPSSRRFFRSKTDEKVSQRPASVSDNPASLENGEENPPLAPTQVTPETRYALRNDSPESASREGYLTVEAVPAQTILSEPEEEWDAEDEQQEDYDNPRVCIVRIPYCFNRKTARSAEKVFSA